VNTRLGLGYCLYIACVLLVYCLCTACVLLVYCLCTACVLLVVVSMKSTLLGHRQLGELGH